MDWPRQEGKREEEREQVDRRWQRVKNWMGQQAPGRGKVAKSTLQESMR